MIAAKRRRKGKRRARAGDALVSWTRRADRLASRALEWAYPWWRRAGREARRAGHVAGAGFDRTVAWSGARLRWLGVRLRPAAALTLRVIARVERRTRRIGRATVRAATAASAALDPRRATGAAIVLAGALLVVSQFVHFSGVEIGQPGYADLPAVANPPTVDLRTAGEAHAYLLVPVGLAAMLLGLGCGRRERRGWGLAVAALGAVGLVVALTIDLPAGLDVGAESARFSGAVAVLKNGFYAELAAAAALVLSGLVYYARPCRIRISLSGRAASARRRRPRRRASSRARVARSALPPRSGAASAPASRR